MPSVKDVIQKQASHNAIPGYCIPGLAIAGTPPANITDIWVEACKANTNWDEVAPNYFSVLYCKGASSAERSVSLNVFKRGR